MLLAYEQCNLFLFAFYLSALYKQSDMAKPLENENAPTLPPASSQD